MKGRKTRKTRNTGILLLVLLLIVTVGYAFLSTTLRANGLVNVEGNTWDVRWDSESISVDPDSASGPAPVVSETDTKVSFTANIEIPGDYYEFTIDAVNAGTVDAMIGEIKTTIKNANNQTVELPDYMHFKVTNEDGTPLQEKHLLEGTENPEYPTREKYKITLEMDIDPEELPSSAISYKIEFQVKYIQADDTATKDPFSDAGAGVYFDPVSTAKCDNTTYNETAVNNGTSTCYRWNIIRYEEKNVVMQLDHNLITGEWLNYEDQENVEPTNSNIDVSASKLGDIDTNVKTTKVGDYRNNEGPYTAMKNLTTATANWTRVPLITNFTHTPTSTVASNDRYTSGFSTITIQDGVYQTGNNSKSRIENVRARMITLNEIEDIIEANNHTLNDYAGQTGTHYENNHSYEYDNTSSFSLESDDTYSWLFNNIPNSKYIDGEAGYWMMTQAYDYDSAWAVCRYAYTYYYETENGVVPWTYAYATLGIRPVITVPKKNVVIVK